MSSKVQFKSAHADVNLKIANGTTNLGKVKNQVLTWKDLVKKLSDPTVTKEALKQYLKLPKERQDQLKNVNGYWIGGHCDGGRRATAAIQWRYVITFDIDDAPADIVERLELGLTGLSGYEWAAHSTRKHTPDKPRLRITIPLAKPLDADRYMPAARIVAALLDSTMDMVDDVSFRVAQMMYWPSHSADSEFVFIHNRGVLLDAQAVLDAFGDWRDFTKLPFSEKQGQKRPSAKKAEDPTTKPGIIGAFCRAYDVEVAIRVFLPDVYAPGNMQSGKPRYSFIGGSTTNGAVVEDGGLFLYSYHSTDPCSDRLVNAWDLVRIHLFGSLDGDKPEDEVSPGKRASFKRMVEHVSRDERVLSEFTDLASAFEDLEPEEPEDPAGAQTEPDVGDESEPAGPRYDDDIEDLIGGTPKPRKPTPLERMNKKHAIARIGGDTVALTFDRDGGVHFGSLTDLNTFYANVPMPTVNGGSEPISAWWSKQPGRRSYPGGVSFAPGGCPATTYNLWTGFAVRPNPKGSCALFLAHVREIVCSGNEAQFRYVIGWLAHMVQRPQEKPGVALVLRGVKGAGKDTVGDYVGDLSPRHHVTISNMEHLTGKFNAHQERALLLHVEEGFWAGNPAAVGALNRIITAESSMIERKGYDPVEMPSVVRIFITSNEDWVVPATAGERRYAVFDVNPTKARNRAYFAKIRHERDNGGLGALLHYLQTYDLSDFDVGVPPNTQGLANQKLVGLRNLDAWWYDVLTNGNLPRSSGFDENETWDEGVVRVNMEAFYGAYKDWLRDRRHHGELLGQKAFGHKLLTLVPERKRIQQRAGRERVWRYILPPLGSCRASFESWLGVKVEWDGDLEDDDDSDIMELL